MRLLINWLDNNTIAHNSSDKIAWLRVIPFLAIHLACLLVFITGVSTVAVLVALGLFWLRIFAIGAFYHRYFSHKAFKTNRAWQFIFAVLGALSVQRGPIWWAAYHRHHHQHSDKPEDPHSPIAHRFWRSHVTWFMSHKYFHYDKTKVKDWLKYPELVWLDRFDTIVPLALMALLYLAGWLLSVYFPGLGTNGLQLLVWGFVVSTVATLHVTVSINSFGHLFGRRRYATKDHSRNNWLLALLTLGEGWHNNHHHYPATAQQGFYWWELDITYYMLWLMEKLGIISELRKVPKHVLKNN